MMDIVTRVAESKIKEAIERGEFDNLEGKGRALQLYDLSNVPEDLRPAYILLNNAGFVPEELQLKKDIISLQDLINCCNEDEDEQQKEEARSLRKKMNAKMLRFNMLLESKQKDNSPAVRGYMTKVYHKLLGT